jgi:hypothetical protein
MQNLKKSDGFPRWSFFIKTVIYGRQNAVLTWLFFTRVFPNNQVICFSEKSLPVRQHTHEIRGKPGYFGENRSGFKRSFLVVLFGFKRSTPGYFLD